MKKYDPPVLRIWMNTPFLSSKWRGNDSNIELKGGKKTQDEKRNI
ncbi:MAG: hypothetical protein NTZ83_04085 [Candidatus Pacearchaeota archaeon]|nr:hypothetical protein [Candidatus Pacearchaeota archaeon]